MSNKIERAEKLKEEGNALFAKKEYKAATQKCTEAIALNDKNPVLYANRAACRLSLKKYMDAGMDAAKATQIDPTYAKAWARLATAQDALLQPHNSKASWQKALDCLPKEGLTEGEKKQKQQYKDGLAAAIDAEKRGPHTPLARMPTFNSSQSHQTPWNIAMSMLPQLQRERNTRSSAWVIADAYQNFEEGSKKMDQLVVMGPLARFNMQSIEEITNGILTDQRCFAVSSSSWLQKFERQLRGENACLNGWTYEPFDTLFQNMEDRIETHGWEKARQTLGTTLRSWIAMGFIDGGFKDNQHTMIEFLGRVVQAIKWGQENWPDMDPNLRGAIFRPTFLRGVQNLHTETLMKLASKENDVPKKLEILQELLQEAEDVIKSVGEDTDPSCGHPSFRLAYYDYPCGHAYAMKGYVSREKAKLTGDKLEDSKLSLEAGVSYMNAANKLPDDDEHYSFYLSVAIECLNKGSASPQLILKVLEQLKSSVPKMQRIWVTSALAIGGRDDIIKQTLGMEEQFRRKVKENQ
ncbi:hypothetical protein WG66_007728 [Moniliophthora roreri]|uniref:Uncharacterized protein n=1 Tax=Moniliophthora roreri TaxID=221103 RepID=A0A0W0G7D0_MONRR|nr:hypothetical protein WG66_007728 [Moniliophthora roreri]